ncbi:MAG: hypothetical protein AAFU71_01470 [Cyanobacteria bacterium J06632_22]
MGDAQRYRWRGLVQRLGCLGSTITGAALLGAQPSWAQMANSSPTQNLIAQATSTTQTLFTQLDEAVCLNQWDDAIALTGVLLALPDISPNYRVTLLGFREELTELRAFEAVVPHSSSCDRTEALTLSPPITAQANATSDFDWRRGIAAITQSNRQIVQLDPTPNDLVNPPIPLALLDSAPIALADAIPLDTRDGFSVVAGAITPNRQQSYAFVARVGDRLTLDLDVTRIAVDAGITGEDSHLFLFDETGRLVSENDDADGRQSRIDRVVVLDTQVYYAVVTSHNNLPILDSDNQLAGWTGTGSTQFDYTLTLTGATPSGEILR